MTDEAIATLLRIERVVGAHAASSWDFARSSHQFRCGPWWGWVSPDGTPDIREVTTGRVAGFVMVNGLERIGVAGVK